MRRVCASRESDVVVVFSSFSRAPRRRGNRTRESFLVTRETALRAATDAFSLLARAPPPGAVLTAARSRSPSPSRRVSSSSRPILSRTPRTRPVTCGACLPTVGCSSMKPTTASRIFSRSLAKDAWFAALSSQMCSHTDMERSRPHAASVAESGSRTVSLGGRRGAGSPPRTRASEGEKSETSRQGKSFSRFAGRGVATREDAANRRAKEAWSSGCVGNFHVRDVRESARRDVGAGVAYLRCVSSAPPRFRWGRTEKRKRRAAGFALLPLEPGEVPGISDSSASRRFCGR